MKEWNGLACNKKGKVHVLWWTEEIANGGVESLWIQWLQLFDQSTICVDIAANRVSSVEMVSKLRQCGAKVFILGKFPYMRLLHLLKSNQFDVVHIHSIVAFDWWVLQAAKLYNVPCRIAHSHNELSNSAKAITKLLHFLSRPILAHYSNAMLSCGEKAAISLYGSKRLKNVYYIHNGVDLQRFCRDEFKRSKIRNDYKVKNDDILIGIVARLSFQKNISFLLRIFENIYRQFPCAKLMIVGDGENASELKKEACNLGVGEKVIFTGVKKEIEWYLNAFDVFVMTSLFEGMPVSLIEAQAVGVPCVISDRITKEINISGRVEFVSLEERESYWADKIMNANGQWYNNKELIISAGYDIKDSAVKLEQVYFDLLSNASKA